METNEERRPIPGYEEYTVSKDGTIFSKSGIPMKKHENQKGYYRARVYKDGRKRWVYNHQAVAKAYIPNPEGLYCINHKDENKKNNSVDNLEWCTLAYNLGYGTKPMKTGLANQRTKGHKVIHIVDGKEIYYPSINSASIDTNIGRRIITRQCETYGEWRYVK